MPDINCTMNKIIGLAAMFSPENMAAPKILSVDACSGLCFMLEDCARELDLICRQYEKQERAYRDTINKLNLQIKELQGNDRPQVDTQVVELASLQRKL